MRQAMLTTAIIWLGFACAASAREGVSPLPEAKQVKTISIKFDHPKLKDDIEFTATPDDWRAIRATLLPAKRDENPPDWEWFGTVKIVKKDGKPFRVELYWTNTSPGAFASGSTFKERAYYRGGTTRKLVKAVYAAYEKSKNNDK